MAVSEVELERLREARSTMGQIWRYGGATWSVDESKGEVVGKGSCGTWTATLRVAGEGWVCVLRSGRMRTTTTAARPARAFDLASHFQTFLERRTEGSETLLDECLCGRLGCQWTPAAGESK